MSSMMDVLRSIQGLIQEKSDDDEAWLPLINNLELIEEFLRHERFQKHGIFSLGFSKSQEPLPTPALSDRSDLTPPERTYSSQNARERSNKSSQERPSTSENKSRKRQRTANEESDDDLIYVNTERSGSIVIKIEDDEVPLTSQKTGGQHETQGVRGREREERMSPRDSSRPISSIETGRLEQSTAMVRRPRRFRENESERIYAITEISSGTDDEAPSTPLDRFKSEIDELFNPKTFNAKRMDELLELTKIDLLSGEFMKSKFMSNLKSLTDKGAVNLVLDREGNKANDLIVMRHIAARFQCGTKKPIKNTREIHYIRRLASERWLDMSEFLEQPKEYRKATERTVKLHLVMPGFACQYLEYRFGVGAWILLSRWAVTPSKLGQKWTKDAIKYLGNKLWCNMAFRVRCEVFRKIAEQVIKTGKTSVSAWDRARKRAKKILAASADPERADIVGQDLLKMIADRHSAADETAGGSGGNNDDGDDDSGDSGDQRDDNIEDVE